MPGFLVHENAVVTCAHAGQARPMVPNPRVKVMGMNTATATPPYVITGCALTGTPNPPCVTAQWTTFSTRVTSNGQPLVLSGSSSICAAPGTPLVIWTTQTRVSAM